MAENPGNLAPLKRGDKDELNAHIRELNSRLKRMAEVQDQLLRAMKLKGPLDADFNRLTNVATAVSDDDAVPLGQLESELTEFERRIREDLTSEASDTTLEDSTSEDEDGGGSGPDDITGALEDAVPTVAPPVVATDSELGTTSDPPVFALSDHTHGGIRATRTNGGVELARRRVNFLDGTGITINQADDPGDDEIDVTIAATGTAGADGRPGPPGIDGDDGEAGFIFGIPGVQGSPGATGDTGPMGPAGFGVLGWDGEQGEDGPMGPPGMTGATGDTGATGPTGLGGPPGFDGDPGEDGPPGPPGPAGAAGAAGADGSFAGNRRFAMLHTRAGQAATATETIANGMVFGMANPTLSGTLAATAVVDTTGSYYNRQAAAAPGGAGYSGAEIGSIDNQGIWHFVMKTGGSIATQRIWIGAGNAGLTNEDTPTAGNVLAFRYSTSVPDTNWIAVSVDGAASVGTTDTGVAVATDTRYYFKIDMRDPTSVKYYINGSLVATRTTQLPAASGTMGFTMFLRNLAAGTKDIRLSHFTAELNGND